MNILARYAPILLINKNKRNRPAKNKCKYPGLPKEVPVVFTPVIIRFFDGIPAQGKKQEMHNTIQVTTANPFTYRMLRR